jgi:hypothetical protein
VGIQKAEEAALVCGPSREAARGAARLEPKLGCGRSDRRWGVTGGPHLSMTASGGRGTRACAGAGRRLGRGRLGRAFGLGPGRIGWFCFVLFCFF